MGLSAIKEIIYNSKIVRLKNDLYLCIYKNWTVKIQLSENQQEYYLYHSGVFMCLEFTYEKEFNIKTFLTLKQFIKKEKLC
jgi:hypothetical protein